MDMTLSIKKVGISIHFFVMYNAERKKNCYYTEDNLNLVHFVVSNYVVYSSFLKMEIFVVVILKRLLTRLP